MGILRVARGHTLWLQNAKGSRVASCYDIRMECQYTTGTETIGGFEYRHPDQSNLGGGFFLAINGKQNRKVCNFGVD